ncbi:MAG: hypothetical protein J6C59_10895 [Muribaculaceae bacterium]|nr:hypothetical protein [Muribaculaceae bacterium]
MNGSQNRNHPGAPKSMRLWFGIFMVLIYIGVGLLFFFDVFSIDNNAISYTVGALLILYGIFRGYRLYKGSN